jgi:hypothetical protein
MELKDVWRSVVHIRDDNDEITAVQVPIDMWRFLIDRVQAMEDREAARARLARLRARQSTDTAQHDE